MSKLVKISEKDNVVTVKESVSKGTQISIDGKSISVNHDIARFHKIAIEDIRKGEIVYKYGETIGLAMTDIQCGDHVHDHNIESTRGRGDKEAK